MRINRINTDTGELCRTGDGREEETDIFSESLRRSILIESKGSGENAGTAETGKRPETEEMRIHREDTQPGEKILRNQFGKSKAENLAACVRKSGETPLIKEVPVRGIGYEECDRMEINILDGYTLKAKLEQPDTMRGTDKIEGAKSRNVYVEMKNDDGETKAFLFSEAGLHRDSKDAMERIAYEAVR